MIRLPNFFTGFNILGYDVWAMSQHFFLSRKFDHYWACHRVPKWLKETINGPFVAISKLGSSRLVDQCRSRLDWVGVRPGWCVGTLSHHGDILGISWECLGDILGISWRYFVDILVKPWGYRGYIWGILRGYLSDSWGIFWGYLWDISGIIGWYLGYILGIPW